MNPTPDMATFPEVLIRLDQGDSAKPLSADQLVQRQRYEHLKGQISDHLNSDHLKTLETEGLTFQDDYPAGSGWTQFLDGTRGAGKSTFLSSAKVALETDTNVNSRMAFIALIDPSRIERSEIILLVILQHLRKRVEDTLKGRRRPEDDRLREKWRQTFRGVAGGLSLFAKDYHPLNDLDPDLFLDWGLERASDSTSLRTKLHHLFTTACHILGVRALMLAFDDADTDSTHAVSLLECIRKYLDAPLMMVLVTGDLELYSLLVRQHFAQTVTGKREAALDLQRRSTQGDRSTQYLRMIDHLEEQYLLKLFPIRRRIQLQPLWNVMLRANCRVTHPAWETGSRPVTDVIHAIVRDGLRVKTGPDVAIYVEFLLKQPLRSVLQVMASCALYLDDSSSSDSASATWSRDLTNALSRSLQALALTSLYKLSVDTDAIAAQELPTLTQAVFDLSLLDGDIDTAPYLRPMSAEPDIRASFAALAAEVPNFCAERPGTALRYLLRGPGSVSLYSLARAQPGSSASVDDRLHQFKSYMGIGRREDSLDWARRATAVIALPYNINPKARVVLPGVVGLNRRKPDLSTERTVRAAIRDAVEKDKIQRLPVFALSIVDVASATGTRTYGSIFTLFGLVEKLLSADPDGDQEARTIFDRAYPSLTVSAPSWMSLGNTEDPEEAERSLPTKPGSESSKKENLWKDIDAWRRSALQLAKATSPSAIFLGKVWTRLFFSLQKASEELRPSSDFGEVMEIFALCVINAFLVEEAEHHLSVSSSPSTTNVRIDRNNPRTSASAFVDKLKSMQLQRHDLPLTSIVATCPLLLGLLDSNLAYTDALKPLFPDETEPTSIQALLCPKELKSLISTVSVAGQSRRRTKSVSPKSAVALSDADKADEE